MRALIAFLAIALLAPTAQAQETGRSRFNPMRYPPTEAGPAVRPMGMEYTRLFERDMVDRQRREQHRWMRSQSTDSRDRADRLAALVNDGQCARAIEIAGAEGDHSMVGNLLNICRGTITVTAPEVSD